MDSILQKIEYFLEPQIKGLGYDLVIIKFFTQGGKKTLQIMIENTDNQQPITIEDCVKVSRHISVLMDVEELIKEEYYMEVSSPGIDRPLVKIKDYEKYIGYPVMIKTANLIDNRKKFKGTLIKVENNEISVLDDEIISIINYDNILDAKLQTSKQLFNTTK